MRPLSHGTLSQRVARSLTLLRVFLVASAAMLAIAAVVLGTILTPGRLRAAG